MLTGPEKVQMAILDFQIVLTRVRSSYSSITFYPNYWTFSISVFLCPSSKVSADAALATWDFAVHKTRHQFCNITLKKNVLFITEYCNVPAEVSETYGALCILKTLKAREWPF